MQSLHTLALLCLAICLVAPALASLTGGNIEGDSFIVAGRCTATTQHGTNAPICTTFCRGGDCSNSKNVYSFAIPSVGMTAPVQPSQIVNTLYSFQIEDPTIVGVVGRNHLVIFSCRDSNCQDYNQATYMSLPGNQTFGASVATTLSAESHLAILYTKTRPASEGPGVELWLDVCKDPLCAIKGTTSHIDTYLGEVQLWLGYDVNINQPLIMVLDQNDHLLRSYACSSSTTCKPTTLVSATDSITAFTLVPYQTGSTAKKNFKTNSFLVAYSTFQTPGDLAELYTMSCSADLTKCQVRTEALPTHNTPYLSLSAVSTGNPDSANIAYVSHTRITTTNAVAAVKSRVASAVKAVFAEEPTTTAAPQAVAAPHEVATPPVAAAPHVPVVTITDIITLGMALCTYPAPCSVSRVANITLPFVADATLDVGVTLLSSEEAGLYAITQAANAWEATANPAVSDIYGLSSKGFFGPMPMETKNILTAKYHKPPPKVTIGLYVLAGVAVITSALVVAWRIWVGRPNSGKPGYAHIN